MMSQTTRSLIVLLLGLLVSTSMICQEAIWSRSQDVALLQNVANTGRYLGSLRLHGSVRGQWASLDQGYQSVLTSVDLPWIRGFGSHDWFGLGLLISQDRSGSIGLSQDHLAMAAAYHISLDAHRHVLSMGTSLALGGRAIKNIENGIFLDELENVDLVSPDRVRFFLNRKTYFDLTLGVWLSSKIKESIQVDVGLQWRHLNRPNYSLIVDTDAMLPTSLELYLSALICLSSLIDIKPAVSSYHHETSPAVALYLDVFYHLTSRVSLMVGTSRLVSDRYLMTLGVQVDRLSIQASYDLFTGPQAPFSNVDGIEISGHYIFKLKRKPKLKSIIFCPRF